MPTKSRYASMSKEEKEKGYMQHKEWVNGNRERNRELANAYYLRSVGGVLKRDTKVKSVKVSRPKFRIDEEGRECTHCNEYKPWDSFSSKVSKKDAHKTATHVFKQPVCKPCAHANTKAWKDSKTPEQLKELYLQRTYGISLYEFEHRLKEQNHCCPLCGKILDVRYTNKSTNPATACVDHCHKTGRVRGILCNECNRGLGYFHDSVSALRRASQYLDHSRLEK